MAEKSSGHQVATPFDHCEGDREDSPKDGEDEAEDSIGRLVNTSAASSILHGHKHSNSSFSLSSQSSSLPSTCSTTGGSRDYEITGKIQLGLCYIDGKLLIHVAKAMGLAAIKRQYSDPYVKLYLIPDKTKKTKQKTGTKRKTTNPVFSENFEYAVKQSELGNYTLWVSVWHHEKFKRNKFLGEVRLQLAHITLTDESILQSHELQEVQGAGSSATLQVALKFCPGGKVEDKLGELQTRGTLYIKVKQAKDLPRMNVRGLTDATVKVYLLPDRSSAGKRKTPVVTGSVNPAWEEEFTYEVTQESLTEERVVEFTIKDQHYHKFIGGLRLGPIPYPTESLKRKKKWMDSFGEEGTHWEEMLAHPGEWVERWHYLRPNMKYRKPLSPSLLSDSFSVSPIMKSAEPVLKSFEGNTSPLSFDDLQTIALKPMSSSPVPEQQLSSEQQDTSFHQPVVESPPPFEAVTGVSGQQQEPVSTESFIKLFPSGMVDQKCKDIHLRDMGRHVADWQKVIGYLEFDDPKFIEANIRQRYPCDLALQSTEMFLEWKQQFAMAATYRKLIEVFVRLGMLGYAERLCDIVSSSDDSVSEAKAKADSSTSTADRPLEHVAVPPSSDVSQPGTPKSMSSSPAEEQFPLELPVTSCLQPALESPRTPEDSVLGAKARADSPTSTPDKLLESPPAHGFHHSGPTLSPPMPNPLRVRKAEPSMQLRRHSAYDNSLKILVVGDSSVGKTSLIETFCKGEFNSWPSATVASDLYKAEIEINGKKVTMNIWDTVGTERFGSMPDQTYRNASGVVFVFDVTNERSFDNIERVWIQEVQERCPEWATKLLVGSKCDLDCRVDLITRGKSYAEERGIKFLKTSAKDHMSVKEMFHTLASEICRTRDQELVESVYNSDSWEMVDSPARSRNRCQNC